MIAIADELRHPDGTDPNWSESYFFTFHDPRNITAGFFRIGMEVNKQQSNMWCHVMRDGQTIYHRFRPNLPYTASGLDDVSVGGLGFRMVEPHDFSIIHECHARYRMGEQVGHGTYEINRRYYGAT